MASPAEKLNDVMTSQWHSLKLQISHKINNIYKNQIYIIKASSLLLWIFFTHQIRWQELIGEDSDVISWDLLSGMKYSSKVGATLTQY